MIDIDIGQVGLATLALLVALAAVRLTFLVIHKGISINGRSYFRNEEKIKAIREEITDLKDDFEDVASRVDEVEQSVEQAEDTEVHRFPTESERLTKKNHLDEEAS